MYYPAMKEQYLCASRRYADRCIEYGINKAKEKLGFHPYGNRVVCTPSQIALPGIYILVTKYNTHIIELVGEVYA